MLAEFKLHNQAGQSSRCLGGLVTEAKRLAKTPRMQATASIGEVVQWIRAQPYLPDSDADKAGRDGCNPHQRLRFWPSGGLNCWEATAHYAAAVIRHGLPQGYTLHLWDVRAKKPIPIGGGIVIQPGARHVYPRLEHDGREELVDLTSTQPRFAPERQGFAQLANSTEGDAATGLDAVGGILSAIVGIYAGPEAGKGTYGAVKLGTNKLRESGEDEQDEAEAEVKPKPKPKKPPKKKPKKRKR